jgi:hypothetical protein
MQRGRIKTKGKAPKVWNEHRLVEVYELSLLGISDERMAIVMGVNVNTIAYWKRTKPEFLKAYLSGRDPVNAEVAKNFLLNCIDRYVEEEQVDVNTRTGKVYRTKVKRFVRGDKWAQKQWLATKLREIWAESSTKGEPALQQIININNLNAFSGLSTELMLEIRKLQNIKGLEEHDGD